MQTIIGREKKMSRVAFLKVLCPAGAKPEMEKIHQKIKGAGFDDVRLAEEYTPNDWDHRLVIWRYNSKDKVSDEEGIQLVGKNGNILYIWQCYRCKHIVRKCEYPGNHEEDTDYGCSCPGTTWGYSVF